jgi:glyoxylase-like metal-dependent hydrolase (beta-lactamase superfamily II)
MNIINVTSTTQIIDTVFEGKNGVLASYIIRGDRTVLIDPGPPVQSLQIIQEFKKNGELIDILAITHIHLDHSAGTWNILQAFPDCKVIVHPRGARHLIDPTNLLKAANRQFKGEMPPYGDVKEVPPCAIIESEDEMTIDQGNRSLQVIWTPGHSTHSQSFFEKDNQLLFVGDAVGQIISNHVLPASPPPFNPDQSLESIDRMISLKPSIICISHFGYRQDAIFYLKNFRDRVKLWRMLSFKNTEDDGSLHDCFELVYQNDFGIKELIQSNPEAMSDVYSSLVGFHSYAEWKKSNP